MRSSTAHRRRQRSYGPPPKPVDEPIHRIPHLPILIFCTVLTCVLSLPNGLLRSHAVTIDLPFPSTSPDLALGFPTDRIVLTENSQALWNAVPVTTSELTALLIERAERGDRSGLVFDPGGSVDYDSALRVLALIKATGNAEAGFCFGDLSPYRRFDKHPGPPIPHGETDMRPCNPAADSRFDRPPHMPGITTAPADPPPA